MKPVVKYFNDKIMVIRIAWHDICFNKKMKILK